MPIKRKWLNPSASMNKGSIHWGLQVDKECLKWPDVILEIRDCSRKVDLDVSFHNEKGRKAALQKVKLIEEAITDLYEQIESFKFPPEIPKKVLTAKQKRIKVLRKELFKLEDEVDI
jgi:hypothetical protein